MKRISASGPALLGLTILGLGLGMVGAAPAQAAVVGLSAVAIQTAHPQAVQPVEYYMRDGHRFWRNPPRHRAPPPPRHDDHHH